MAKTKKATNNVATKKVVTKVLKTNKHLKVKSHLETHKSITSLEAIDKYGATRLSAIIFNLKKKSNMDIVTKELMIKDRYGNTCKYAQYILQTKVKQSVSKK